MFPCQHNNSPHKEILSYFEYQHFFPLHNGLSHILAIQFFYSSLQHFSIWCSPRIPPWPRSTRSVTSPSLQEITSVDPSGTFSVCLLHFEFPLFSHSFPSLNWASPVNRRKFKFMFCIQPCFCLECQVGVHLNESKNQQPDTGSIKLDKIVRLRSEENLSKFYSP